MEAASNSRFSSVGIIGAGFMGSGIAEAVAAAGIEVVLHEPEEEPLDHSRDRVAQSVERAVKTGKRTAEEAESLQALITWSTDPHALAASELAIEAIAEVESAKVEVFSMLDEILPPEALIASNTSSIPIADLAAATERPDRVLGTHFFSPVPVMKLVEIVAALETSEGTVAAAEAFAAQIGKKSIRTKDRSGFVVNALLVPYMISAIRMYESGFASRDDIDTGMKLGCGHPMGPLKLCDFVGLDVLYSVCNSLYDEFKREEYAPPPLLKRMVAAGHLGHKAGKGFYEYESSGAAIPA